jgi:hypothetical protein
MNQRNVSMKEFLNELYLLFQFNNEYLCLFEWYQKVKGLANGIDVGSALIERGKQIAKRWIQISAT